MYLTKDDTLELITTDTDQLDVTVHGYFKGSPVYDADMRPYTISSATTTTIWQQSDWHSDPKDIVFVVTYITIANVGAGVNNITLQIDRSATKYVISPAQNLAVGGLYFYVYEGK